MAIAFRRTTQDTNTRQSAQPTIVADTMFLHERGVYNTLYFFTYFGGVTIGPVISGPMTQHINWRSFWWFNVAYNATVFLAVVAFFPETRWHRLRAVEVLRRASITAEKVETEQVQHEGLEESKLPAADIDDGSVPSKEASLDPYLGRGTPSKAQFRVFQTNAHPFKSLLQEFWVPWKLFAFPIVEFAAFAVSWSASVFLTLNLTQSQIFSGAPYNFSPQTIGFFNFATFIGAGIGLFTSGPLSDWVSMRATRKKNGIREPEMRLPTMIPYVIVMIIGNFVVAYGYQNKWNWKVCFNASRHGLSRPRDKS